MVLMSGMYTTKDHPPSTFWNHIFYYLRGGCVLIAPFHLKLEFLSYFDHLVPSGSKDLEIRKLEFNVSD